MALFKGRPSRRPAGDPREDTGATLSAEDTEKVKNTFRLDFGANPPRICAIRGSGSGKSSVINRMFRTNLLVSHTQAGTKKFLATPISVRILKGPAKEPINLIAVDAPGLGEDVSKIPGDEGESINWLGQAPSPHGCTTKATDLRGHYDLGHTGHRPRRRTVHAVAGRLALTLTDP